jgi:low temperature requirement protein LtrA
MELFFDLIFAAAVAQIGTPLSMDYSAAGLLRYAVFFVLIWLAWSGNTLYCTQFDIDDLVQRVSVVLQTFIAAVMAANAREPLDSSASAGFGAAYAGMRLLLAAQYLRARSIPETRALTTRFAAGYAVSAGFWIASAVSPLPARYALWAIGLILDFATPWIARRHPLGHLPDSVHFPERYGLFTIILLGEFVAAVMRGIESQEGWSLVAASTAIVSMSFGFVTWWAYFDGAKGSTERHIRTMRQAILFHLWDYAHLPLFLGLGVASVGFHHAISVTPGAAMAPGEGAVLCAAVAVLMLALSVIGATTGAPRIRIVWELTPVLVVGALAPMASRMPAVFLVLGLGVCLFTQTVLSFGWGTAIPPESQ